jgi:hypothetical protein
MRNRVLRAAIILDVVAVVAPLLAFATLVLGLGNNSFAAVALPLLIILVVAALLAGPIALILGIIALRRSRETGDRGGSIAVIVISAILTLLIVGGSLATLRIPIG